MARASRSKASHVRNFVGWCHTHHIIANLANILIVGMEWVRYTGGRCAAAAWCSEIEQAEWAVGLHNHGAL